MVCLGYLQLIRRRPVRANAADRHLAVRDVHRGRVGQHGQRNKGELTVTAQTLSPRGCVEGEHRKEASLGIDQFPLVTGDCQQPYDRSEDGSQEKQSECHQQDYANAVPEVNAKLRWPRLWRIAARVATTLGI